MEAKFKKLTSGEWVAFVTEQLPQEQTHLEVVKADGSKKTVKLTGRWSRIDGGFGYCIHDDRPMRQLAQGRRPSNLGRYQSKHEGGVCELCEFNQDAGDGRGCAKHRGNPRV